MTFIVDIVTGSSQGIGRAVAESIAHHRSLELAKSTAAPLAPGYALFLIGRNQDRGAKSAKDIQSLFVSQQQPKVYFEKCDLSNYNDVLDLKGRIKKRLNESNATAQNQADNDHCDYKIGILVNNAAECPASQEFVYRPRIIVANDSTGGGGSDGTGTNACTSSSQIVEEKIDKQFASNVLGYHFMMKAFESHFAANIIGFDDATTKPTHVVNIASNWAGDLDFGDLHFINRRYYDNDTAYRQSKQCNRMLSKIWSERLHGIALVNSCHPGDPCTTLSKALGYNMWSSPPTREMIESQRTIPYLCGFGSTNKSKISSTGNWYDGGTNPTHCRLSSMTDQNKRLFDICESFATTFTK